MYYIYKDELKDLIEKSIDREEIMDYIEKKTLNPGIFINIAAIIFILYQIPLLVIYVSIFVIVELIKKFIKKVKNLYDKNN